MTEGEWRVGVDFNPSKDPRVDDIKKRCAAIIDEMLNISENRHAAGARCAAEAATCFETAAMWAVKALTKKERQK
jgi:hypothetical protein